MDAGDVVFFHSLLIHGTGQNVGVFDRVADIISYMPSAARVAGAEPTDSPLAVFTSIRLVNVEPAHCPVCPPGTTSSPVARGQDFEYGTTGDLEWTIETCAGCGSRLLQPRPTVESIPLLYPPNYEPYQFDHLPRPIKFARDLVQRRKVTILRRLAPEEATILDLGCGSGSFLRLLQEHGTKTWRLIGWDFPGPHIAKLADDGVEAIGAPIDGAHAPAIMADVIVMNQVIEHFADPRAPLDVALALLRPGGYLIIETPDVGGLDAELFDARLGGYHFPRHLVSLAMPRSQHSLSRLGSKLSNQSAS